MARFVRDNAVNRFPILSSLFGCFSESPGIVARPPLAS